MPPLNVAQSLTEGRAQSRVHLVIVCTAFRRCMLTQALGHLLLHQSQLLLLSNLALSAPWVDLRAAKVNSRVRTCATGTDGPGRQKRDISRAVLPLLFCKHAIDWSARVALSSYSASQPQKRNVGAMGNTPLPWATCNERHRVAAVL